MLAGGMVGRMADLCDMVNYLVEKLAASCSRTQFTLKARKILSLER